MADKLMKYEKNCTTGEETYTEFTAAEVAEYHEISAEIAAKKVIDEAAAIAAAEAKASGLAKLLALGLTEAEANALVK